MRQCAVSLLAQTMTPEVCLSSRCTTPGRAMSSPTVLSVPPELCRKCQASALMSVPLLWLRAGWTMRSGCLLMMMRWSSSKRIWSGIFSAAMAFEGGGGSVATTRSPRRSLVLAFGTRALTVTASSSISFWSCVRLRKGTRRARKRSRRRSRLRVISKTAVTGVSSSADCFS